MCVRVCVNICAYACTYGRACAYAFTCVRACAYTCTYVRACAYACTRVRACAYTCAHVRIHLRKYKYVSIRSCICVSVCVRIKICLSDHVQAQACIHMRKSACTKMRVHTFRCTHKQRVRVYAHVHLCAMFMRTYYANMWAYVSLQVLDGVPHVQRTPRHTTGPLSLKSHPYGPENRRHLSLHQHTAPKPPNEPPRAQASRAWACESSVPAAHLFTWHHIDSM